jgi:hypothetical protein
MSTSLMHSLTIDQGVREGCDGRPQWHIEEPLASSHHCKDVFCNDARTTHNDLSCAVGMAKRMQVSQVLERDIKHPEGFQMSPTAAASARNSHNKSARSSEPTLQQVHIANLETMCRNLRLEFTCTCPLRSVKRFCGAKASDNVPIGACSVLASTALQYLLKL